MPRAQARFYETKADAVAAVRAMQARGVQSIDVGCGQINLMHHPDAFASLEQAFDPQANAAYAARFLKELFAQTGDWSKAAAMYHSATPELGADYQQKGTRGLAGGAALGRPRGRDTAGPGLERHDDRAGVGVHARPARAADGDGAGATCHHVPNVGGVTAPGRGLDAYRAMPIGLAFQPSRRIGG